MFDSNTSSPQKVQSSTGLIFESRELGSSALSKVLARDIFERLSRGNIAVVTDKPVALLSAVRKQWLRFVGQARRAQSSTLDRDKRLRATHELIRLQNTVFTAANPASDPIANVYFAAVEQFLLAPPMCPTLVIAGRVERHELYMLSSWMSRGSLVITYGQN